MLAIRWPGYICDFCYIPHQRLDIYHQGYRRLEKWKMFLQVINRLPQKREQAKQETLTPRTLKRFQSVFNLRSYIEREKGTFKDSHPPMSYGLGGVATSRMLPSATANGSPPASMTARSVLSAKSKMA